LHNDDGHGQWTSLRRPDDITTHATTSARTVPTSQDEIQRKIIQTIRTTFLHGCCVHDHTEVSSRYDGENTHTEVPIGTSKKLQYYDRPPVGRPFVLNAQEEIHEYITKISFPNFLFFYFFVIVRSADYARYINKCKFLFFDFFLCKL